MKGPRFKTALQIRNKENLKIKMKQTRHMTESFGGSYEILHMNILKHGVLLNQVYSRLFHLETAWSWGFYFSVLFLAALHVSCKTKQAAHIHSHSRQREWKEQAESLKTNGVEASTLACEGRGGWLTELLYRNIHDVSKVLHAVGPTVNTFSPWLDTQASGPNPSSTTTNF